MNHISIRFKKVAGKLEPAIIEVSADFENTLMEVVKEQTSLDIDLLRADKTRFFDSQNGAEMVRYAMVLNQDKVDELHQFANMLYMRLYPLIYHNQN